MKKLITNVELLHTPNGEMHSIAIDGNKIVGIDVADFVADEVIDGKGKLATPGMVNTHGHVSMTILRSYADDLALMDWLNNHIWPVEGKMVAEDIYWGAMLGITEMLKGGTTCFADMYSEMDSVAKACDQLGIRANLCRGMIGFQGNAMDALAENVKLFEDWHGHDEGRIRVTLGPHAPYTCPDEFLKKVIATAKEKGIEIQMHLCETLDEINGSQKDYGMTPIERMDKLGMFEVGTIAAHAVHLTDHDREIMAKHNVRIAHNPQSNLKLASGIAEVAAAKKAGIVVGLGADGTSSNNNLDMLEEIRLAAMLHKATTLDPLVVPAAEAWQMGTLDGAKVLGFENVGLLEPGYEADIVLWDMHKPYWYPRHNKLSLLVYAASANDADTVFVAGKKVLEGGKLVTFDEEVIYKMINERTAALLAK
ncbi:MAG: amidohydrolase [Phascolarctobacterium sp.]|nr:amidohydrolase [Phascolarctobacterium sp.]